MRHYVNGGNYCHDYEWTECQHEINAVIRTTGHSGRLTFREIAQAARAGAVQLELFAEAR